MKSKIQIAFLSLVLVMSACSKSEAPPVVHDDSNGADSEISHYTCPMHPSVQESDPGTCPICKMDTVPVTSLQKATGEVVVEEGLRKQIGVGTEVARVQTLERTLRALGVVQWDEARIKDVSARVEGWVGGLKTSRTGDTIQRGRTLLKLYSPALYATQKEMLNAPEDSRLSQKARERLHLWGLDYATIEKILISKTALENVPIHAPSSGVIIKKAVNDGAHVKAGDLLFQIADPTEVWIEAEIFEQDLGAVTEGQPVRIHLPNADGLVSNGVIERVYPTVDPTTRTGRVRVRIPNPEGTLRPGMLADLFFDVSMGKSLAVPPDAVVHMGARNLIFVDRGNGRLVPVEVKIGARTRDWVVVESGINDGDTIVSSGVFLIAAESRINSTITSGEDSHVH
jgi:Cu(I)/Ag(I) efflux system membrane fusion protein